MESSESLENNCGAVPGDYVSFQIHRDHFPEADGQYPGLREGMYLGGDLVRTEFGNVDIRAESLERIVPFEHLFNSTQAWVMEWRSKNTKS